MANGNILVNVLRGALAPLALDKQRQQRLEDERSVLQQEAQLKALLEAFKLQGRSQIQGQRDREAMNRVEVQEGARADRQDKSSRAALKRALRVARVGQRGTSRAARQAFEREAPERELDARLDEASILQKGASARASDASAGALNALAEQRVSPNVLKILSESSDALTRQLDQLPKLGGSAQDKARRKMIQGELDLIHQQMRSLAPTVDEVNEAIASQLAVGTDANDILAFLVNDEGIPDSEARRLVEAAGGVLTE